MENPRPKKIEPPNQKNLPTQYQPEQQQDTRNLPAVPAYEREQAEKCIDLLQDLVDTFEHLQLLSDRERVIEHQYGIATYRTHAIYVEDSATRLIQLLRETLKGKQYPRTDRELLSDWEVWYFLNGLSEYLGFCRSIDTTDGGKNFPFYRNFFDVSYHLTDTDWQKWQTLACDIIWKRAMRRGSAEGVWGYFFLGERAMKRQRINYNWMPVGDQIYYMDSGDDIEHSYWNVDWSKAISDKTDMRPVISDILESEEKRFREFVEVVRGTLQFLTTISRFTSGRSWPPRTVKVKNAKDTIGEAIDVLDKLLSNSVVLPEPRVIEVVEEEEDEDVAESYFEAQAFYQEPSYYEPSVKVAPLISPTTPTILGYEVIDGVKTDKHVRVDDMTRRAGCYVVGKPNMGKSSELEAMIYQDIAKGYSVIVFDPHGDLISNTIARMPEQFLQKTYLFDLADKTHMFGLNIFSCKDIENEDERDKTYGSVQNAFRKLFPEADKKFFDTSLRHVAYTLIEHPEMTLQDIPRFIQDEIYREGKIKHLRHKQTKNYWQQTFSKRPPSKQQTETDPFLNRVDQLLSSNVIRRALCQPQATIDFRRAIENRSILLVRLPVEEERYKEAASILGTILLSKITAATFSFSDIAKAEDRPGFSFYIDEFQNFESTDMATLIEQAREYGVRLCLAHQNRTGQLTLKDVEAATIGASTSIFFQTIADDSRDLARSISGLQLKTRPDHIPLEVLKLLPYHENPQVKAFSNLIVVPLQRWQGKEEDLVEQSGLFHWYQDTEKNIFGRARRQFKEGLHEIEVFLRDAMLHQQVDLDKLEYLMNIFAVRLGYVNYYLHSFLEVPRTKKTWVRVDDEEIHYRHVAPTEEEAAKEKKAYDTFRAVLITVANILIAEPVGEKRETTQDERADFLSSLARRTAVTRIENTTVVMQTRDLDEVAKAVTDAERDKRKRQIIDRTHARYCKANEEIDEFIYEKYEANEPPQSDTLQKLTRSHPDLALARMRKDIEKSIDPLYAKFASTNSKSSNPGLTAMVHGLRKQSIFDESITTTLLKIIKAANHALHTDAVIKAEQVLPLIKPYREAIAALARVLQTNKTKTDETKSTWDRFEPLE